MTLVLCVTFDQYCDLSPVCLWSYLFAVCRICDFGPVFVTFALSLTLVLYL